jgi:D-3-phosphoglycerate dehydrogenase
VRAGYTPFDDVLREADVISLHTPLTPETRHMIGEREFSLMKSTAILINTARGNLVDEAALVEALRSGHMAGAALDVFDEEPLASGSPLRSLPKVILTPHIAASTVEAQRYVGTQIVDQVLAALRGEDYPNAVNVPVVDAGVFRTLGPYLLLAEKLGSLQMQLAEGRIKRVEVEFRERCKSTRFASTRSRRGLSW